MIEEQPIQTITPETLMTQVLVLRHEGYRLAQIGATPLKEIVELNYSFDKDGKYLTLRMQLPADAARVPSITSIYWCAFVYENELHDLFKIQVDGMAIDFKGKLYITSVAFPFAPKPADPAPPSPVTAATSAPPTTVPATPAQ